MQDIWPVSLILLGLGYIAECEMFTDLIWFLLISEFISYTNLYTVIRYIYIRVLYITQ